MIEADTEPDSEAASVRLVLASAAETRAALLRAAGVCFAVRPARVDEGEVKRAMRASDPDGGASARALAVLKARRVSAQAPGAYVIGADQLLVCGEDWFDKPVDMADARAQLLRLRGRRHELVTAVSVVRDDAEIWGDLTRARLMMRSFSDAFLDRYLDRVGDRVLRCVGGYEAEGLGVQLFSEITGDWFAILGLPLMSLLAFLREHRLVAT